MKLPVLKEWKTVILLFILLVSLTIAFSISADKYQITLFFLDESDASLLVSEERNVEMSNDIIERIKVVLRNLIAGSEENLINAIPKETEIKEIFLDVPNKTIYIDFSDSIRENHISGTTAELMTISSVFKTLQVNFPETIEKVQILINGYEIDTLAGHIALSQPLPIDILETKE